VDLDEAKTVGKAVEQAWDDIPFLDPDTRTSALLLASRRALAAGRARAVEGFRPLTEDN
jgi:hypothetical protein